jgi:hypothetical protein
MTVAVVTVVAVMTPMASVTVMTMTAAAFRLSRRRAHDQGNGNQQTSERQELG